MTKKQRALRTLVILVVTVLVANVALLPNLHFFMNVGTQSSMISTGQTVGQALGQAFGGQIMEFVGMVLFLA